MLECKKITCIREDSILFEDLSFIVNAGEIVQLEGDNGVGKTSLFRLIAGLSKAYSGDVFWQGEVISETRESYNQQLLYLGHKIGIKPELTALENLQFFQKMHHSYETIDLWDVLAKVGLAGYEDITTSQLSAGQQRRVALARLWINNSRLWLLDEPFTSLDKSGIAVLQKLFIKHAESGGMILLTSHQDLTLDTTHYSKISLQKTVADLYV